MDEPVARRVLKAAELEEVPRHAELRSRIADRAGVVLSPPRLDESWGRRHLAGEGTRGEHRDTVQLGKLAPAPRITSLVMRGSLGPRGSCLLRPRCLLPSVQFCIGTLHRCGCRSRF